MYVFIFIVFNSLISFEKLFLKSLPYVVKGLSANFSFLVCSLISSIISASGILLIARKVTMLSIALGIYSNRVLGEKDTLVALTP
jgi:hypothetical protein